MDPREFLRSKYSPAAFKAGIKPFNSLAGRFKEKAIESNSQHFVEGPAHLANRIHQWACEGRTHILSAIEQRLARTKHIEGRRATWDSLVQDREGHSTWHAIVQLDMAIHLEGRELIRGIRLEPDVEPLR